MSQSIVQKQLNILDYALSSLVRRKLKNGGIFLVFAAVIFLLASFQLVTGALTQSADNILTSVPDITVQQMEAGRQVPISKLSLKKLDKLFGIRKKSGRIWGYYFDEKNGANYTVLGLDFSRIKADKQLNLSLAHGRFPTVGSNGEVVLGPSVLRNLDLGTRQSFSLFRPDLSMASFKKVGVFSSETALVSDDLIIMSIDDARNLFAMAEGEVTDLMIQVGNACEIDTIARKIGDLLPGVRIITKAQIGKTYQVVFSWRSGFGSICLIASLAAFVILAWDKASGLSQEEKKEVGILKILGWQTSDIMTIRFFESCVVSGLSFIVGYTLAWIHVSWYDGVLFSPVLLGWSVLKPSYSLVPVLSLTDILLVFSFSVVPYLGATVVPAWRSAIVRPDSVI